MLMKIYCNIFKYANAFSTNNADMTVIPILLGCCSVCLPFSLAGVAPHFTYTRPF